VTIQRFRSAWGRIDPGGIRISRGIHLVLSLLLGAGLGYGIAGPGAAWLEARFGGWLADHIPLLQAALGDPRRYQMATMVGGLCATHLILFTPPSSRAVEWRHFRRLTAVVFGYFLIIGLAAPGSWGLGQTPMLIVWVFVIGGGLFIRRYGPTAGSIGVTLMILSLFGMVLEPTRAEGLWMPVAAAVGACAAAIVRFGTYRPSAVAAYDAERGRFQRGVASLLTDLARQLRSPIAAPEPLPNLWNGWASMRKAMKAAALEDPPRRELFQGQTAMDYRLILATEALTDSLARLASQPLPTNLPLHLIADAIDKASERAARAGGIQRMNETPLNEELRPVRDSIVQADASRLTKLQALRALTSLIRIDLALEPTLSRAPSMTPMPSIRPAQAQHARTVSSRLALQGLVAGGITSVLAIWLQLDHAYWATLTVALVLSGTMGETLNKTIKRAGGTTVGVLCALTLVPLLGTNLWPGLLFVLLAIAAVPVFIDTRYEIASGLIGFTVVFGLHVIEHLSFASMLARIYETFIGAAIALIVAFLVVPIYSIDRIGGKLSGFLERCCACFVEICRTASLETNEAAPLAESLRELMEERPALETENWLIREQSSNTSDRFVLLEALVSYLGLFERARAAYRHHSKNPTAAVQSALQELDDQILATFHAQKKAQPFPNLQDLIPRFAQVSPLDGSVPAAEAFHLVEQLYYGRRLAETLKNLAQLPE